MKIAYIKVAAFASFVSVFFFPSYQKLESTGDNIFTVYLNGTQVGIVADGRCGQGSKTGKRCGTDALWRYYSTVYGDGFRKAEGGY